MISKRKFFSNLGVSLSSIHYIGGLTVLLNFRNTEEASVFLCKHDEWKDWFGQLDMWQGQSLPYDRIAWLKVLGVPLNLVEEEVFRRIGQEFGNVIHVVGLNPEIEDLSVNRVGVLIGDGNRNNNEVTLVWKRKSFNVWVSEEVDDWVPECLQPVDISGEEEEGNLAGDSSSEVESSEEEEQCPHSFNDAMHEERGSGPGDEVGDEKSSGKLDSNPLEHSLMDPATEDIGGGDHNSMYFFNYEDKGRRASKRTKMVSIIHRS
ncbi:hypothetical protein HanRHA438_Chr10g0460341 [Helianthus annuus]|uniref:Nucleotide-binding alpha-beta plait domain-containing protein n=1 Tax=Helianthus annuus TaxID=4232 RepID=A0A9K3HZ64_HELAN|nr:hypothetical protein HanXRQr2_Chr10g0447801 [Helianthus annuus]KAJ0522446.1 hypothetical protein HanIR_Chr10g0482741 [Helianthus annuus]KAJ0880186.1 hypothetical protein HanRHA438_Chr10g0460341 [Helianthus annuus]